METHLSCTTGTHETLKQLTPCTDAETRLRFHELLASLREFHKKSRKG